MESDELNKLTLQMFSNRGLYRRHLEKLEPENYVKRCEYLENIVKHRKKMRQMTVDFLDNPDTDFNTEVNEMFSSYANTLIRYLEMKEMDEKGAGCYENTNDDDDDENILFATSKQKKNETDDVDDRNVKETTKYYSKNRLEHFFDR